MNRSVTVDYSFTYPFVQKASIDCYLLQALQDMVGKKGRCPVLRETTFRGGGGVGRLGGHNQINPEYW